VKVYFRATQKILGKYAHPRADFQNIGGSGTQTVNNFSRDILIDQKMLA
jgi:hypothetical protein